MYLPICMVVLCLGVNPVMTMEVHILLFVAWMLAVVDAFSATFIWLAGLSLRKQHHHYPLLAWQSTGLEIHQAEKVR